MNRGKATFDRTMTLLLAVLFGALAFWGIGLYLNVSVAESISSSIDGTFWAELSGRDNYNGILIGAAVVTGLLALLLTGLNIERKRLSRRASPSSATTGTIRVSPADIASAVAQTFEKRDDVRSVSYRATEDRRTDIIEIRLRVPAETDIAGITQACRRAAEDIVHALPGQDIRPRFLLQTEHPAREH